MARANPRIWEKAKARAKARMGGKHSARAMQLAAKYYRDMGGKYTGAKTAAQKSMTKWTKQDWGTKSGKNSVLGKMLLVSAICLKGIVKSLPRHSMPPPLEKSELILRRENNSPNNPKRSKRS
jgi:hypothetical protein